MPTKYVRFDWAIKKLLRQKANFQVLEGFLSVLLKESIKIERILESEGNQETYDDKFNRVDIIAENSKQEIIIIEVQVNREADYFQRMLYGTAKVITEYMKLGEEYGTLRKVYSVNVVYFDLGQGEDYVYHGKTEFVGVHNNDKLNLTKHQKHSFNQEELSGIFPEYYVLKVNQFNDVAKDSLDEWIYYLKNSDIKLEYDAQGLDLVKEKLMYERLSKFEQTGYVRHLGNMSIEKGTIQTSLEDGIEIGKIKGIQEATLIIAREMISDGENDEKIMKYTKLSKEQIEELRNI